MIPNRHVLNVLIDKNHACSHYLWVNSGEKSPGSFIFHRVLFSTHSTHFWKVSQMTPGAKISWCWDIWWLWKTWTNTQASYFISIDGQTPSRLTQTWRNNASFKFNLIWKVDCIFFSSQDSTGPSSKSGGHQLNSKDGGSQKKSFFKSCTLLWYVRIFFLDYYKNILYSFEFLKMNIQTNTHTHMHNTKELISKMHVSFCNIQIFSTIIRMLRFEIRMISFSDKINLHTSW